MSRKQDDVRSANHDVPQQRQDRPALQRSPHPPRHPTRRLDYRSATAPPSNGSSTSTASTDPRSGITNDPNREGDDRYILRLIGQVITVSLETQKIIATLPSLNFPV